MVNTVDLVAVVPVSEQRLEMVYDLPPGPSLSAGGAKGCDRVWKGITVKRMITCASKAKKTKMSVTYILKGDTCSRAQQTPNNERMPKLPPVQLIELSPSWPFFCRLFLS